MKLGFVITWFGKDLKGGAEQQAWQLTQRLQASGVDVHVLTTCSESFHRDWHTNYYAPGITTEGLVQVHRFLVDPRPDTKAFGKTVDYLLSFPLESLTPGVSPVSEDTEDSYVHDHVNSEALLKYLNDEKDTYDLFLFMPYLFPVVLRGLPMVADKALLQPCLHDEAYAYLPAVEYLFACAKGLLFNSRGEQLLAERLFPGMIQHKSWITGEGVEITEALSLPTPRRPPSPKGPLFSTPFILYLGKRCEEKNTPMLLDAFEAFVERTGSKLCLALVGTGHLHRRPRTEQVYDVGLVSEYTKKELLERCKALVNPSVNESFSRVIFEAWLCQKPVLVHRSCLATFCALEDSLEAGWAADTPESFQDMFQHISICSDALLQALGQKGSAYARTYGVWEPVIERYLDCFAQVLSGPPVRSQGPDLLRACIEKSRTPSFSWATFDAWNKPQVNLLVASPGRLTGSQKEHLEQLLHRFANVYGHRPWVLCYEDGHMTGGLKTSVLACDVVFLYEADPFLELYLRKHKKTVIMMDAAQAPEWGAAQLRLSLHIPAVQH